MALTSSQIIEVRDNGSNANGGAFNPDRSTMHTGLEADAGTGNTNSPVVSSSVYSFITRDEGHYLFIRSGTNWNPGWYRIVSTSGGKATLDASIGAVVTWGTNALGTTLNTVAGVATVGTPTNGQWTIDYSQGTAINVTDMVIDPTSNSRFSSAATPLGVSFIGNILKITGGTNFTIGRYEIQNTAGDGTLMQCDAALGTAGATGGTCNIGGPLADLVEAASMHLTRNTVFVKGSFTQTNSASFTQGLTPGATTNFSRILGYSTYRGDEGRASITLSNVSTTAIAIVNNGYIVANFDIDCGELSGTRGISSDSQYIEVWNVKVKGAGEYGMAFTGAHTGVFNCEITGMPSIATAALNFSASTAQVARWNYIHDNACTGVIAAGSIATIEYNIIAFNTGTTSDGIQATSFAFQFLFNTIHNNGRDGIRTTHSSAKINGFINGNLITNHTAGYGINSVNNNAPYAYNDGNAFYNNILDRSNFVVSSGNDAAGRYTFQYDIVLTGDPFVDAVNDDYRLNDIVGAGAACRGTAPFGIFPGNAVSISYRDFGAIQHQDSGGGSSTGHIQSRVFTGM